MRTPIAAALLALVSFSATAADPWRDANLAGLVRDSAPAKARGLTLDLGALGASLAQLPGESASASLRPLLSVPMPDGSVARFRVYATSVMAPELAAKFPEIRTFAGRSEDGSSGRFDLGPRGFHGQVFTRSGTVYIDPLARGDTVHYQSYYGRELPARARGPERLFQRGVLPAAAPNAQIGGQLRTYRLALATTGEYSKFQDPVGSGSLHTPRKPIVLAELVNVTNRVTGVYERDLGVRMQLIADEDKIIFTNAATDPYANVDGTSMVETNTTVLNAKVGSGAYDVGHVVSTGGGGVAGLGVVCGSDKGAGVTGLPAPVGDAFYIDFVAHEMGHEFGGNHTFNSEAGNCGGGNRNGPTAVEPGSGISIMAYAGICAEDDLAPHSEDYFHSTSTDEIVAYTRSGEGNACPAKTATANHAPQVDAGAGYTIPRQTPFELSGSAIDEDGDALTYQWEEFDIGPAGGAETPVGSAPLFRDFQPSASPLRTFPRLADLLAGTHHIGELLPAIERDLNFRLTARDNRVAPDGGGVGSDTTTLHVAAAAGPFAITAPNDDTARHGLDAVSVTWNVAGTDAAPVSCAKVDIRLSLDGGQTWERSLKAATPNDGAETVKLPNLDVAAARIKVKCTDNVFFDVSDADFAIAAVDTTPDAFHFIDRTGVAPGKVYFSNAVAISGLGVSVQGKLTSSDGADWQVNSGPFNAKAKPVANGDTVRLRLTAATTANTARTARLLIGTVGDTWSVRTAK
jgi:hypothetical protein